MEDDTKSDPKGNKEIIAETDNKAGKEKQLDWKDDEDGAEGLKSKLLDDKGDAVVDVMTVAKETVTKVIEDAKQKVAETSADKTTTIEDGGDKDDEDDDDKDDDGDADGVILTVFCMSAIVSPPLPMMAPAAMLSWKWYQNPFLL